MSADDTLVTISEAAAILRCSPRTVARLQADGLLHPVFLTSVRNRRLRFFRAGDVRAIAARRIAA